MANPVAQIASRWILDNKSRLAEAILAEQYRLTPSLQERHGEKGRSASLRDTGYHLEMLASALDLEALDLFAGYLEWVKPLLSARNVPEENVVKNLQVMSKILGKQLPGESREMARAYLAVGVEAYRAALHSIPSAISAVSPLSALAQEYLSALLAADRQRATSLVLDAVESGVSVAEIYLGVFQTVQYEIGRLWQVNKINVAQEHFCTAATQLVMARLYPYILTGEKNGNTVVATSAQGELHELGIRMVADFFELGGWDSYYLGANSPASSIVEAVKSQRANLLAISTSLISHLNQVREVIHYVRADPACSGVKILVGGHPFNSSPSLWRLVGADGHARNAAEAVEVGCSLVQQEVPA